MNHEAARREVIETARSMKALGLTRGTSGNVSVRVADGYLVTPSGVVPEALTLDSIVLARLGGEPDGRASTEWRIHRDILVRRPEVAAVVHAHPPFSTALACAGLSIPAFHYMVAVAGGTDIRCATYATFGTQELSDQVLAALESRRACLMGQHGSLAVGASLAKALALAQEVEALAEQYHHVMQLGPPRILDAAEMQRVLAKFETYAGR